MKISEFMGYLARRFDAGETITQGESEYLGSSYRPLAAKYLALTFPAPGDEREPRNRQARVLGFLFAAAMAREDGC